jgi:hypothetical protein
MASDWYTHVSITSHVEEMRDGSVMPMSERDLVVPKYVHDLGSSAPHRTIALG